MDINQTYRTIQSRQSTHSGKGISYYSRPNMCGRQARLYEEYATQLAQDRARTVSPSDALEESGLQIGTYYHQLMELWLRGQLDDEVWDQTDDAYEDGNFSEAVRLIRGYQREWVSPLERWAATVVSVEETVSSSPERTGRTDAIFNILDVHEAYEQTGLQLPQPGNYIMDWKTRKSTRAMDQWEFRFGLQGANYLGLVRKMLPHLHIRGQITETITRHEVLTRDSVYAATGRLKKGASWGAYFQESNPDDEKVIAHFIDRGTRAKDAGEANAAVCFSGYEPCVFFKLQLCPRY